jgi:hypothetical protein
LVAYAGWRIQRWISGWNFFFLFPASHPTQLKMSFKTIFFFKLKCRLCTKIKLKLLL